MLNHKNIIQLFHAFLEGKQLVMIMEFAGGGELLNYVEGQGRLQEVEARGIFSQIVNALMNCHQRGIVHRDLKLENVLFKSNIDHLVKVVDFGIAGVCAGSKKDKIDAGSIAYMPPEVLKGVAETNPLIDVWAIGMMFYALLYGHLPFWADNEDDFIDRIVSQPVRFDKDVYVSHECQDLILKMLDKDPEKRI